MKTKILTVFLIVTALLMVGCDNDDDAILFDATPATPQGVYSVTGNQAVFVYWNGPYESDIASYIVWRSLEPIDNYQEIAVVAAVDNPNLDLLIYEYIDQSAVNGVTYYYAVSSVDNAGHVSELSAEMVFDTPRPEGQAILYDFAVQSSLSGFNLAAHQHVEYDSEAADIYIDRIFLDQSPQDSTMPIFYINAANLATDIQDVGYTDSFDEVGWAPTDGWSEIGWFEIIVGHTYVIWTADLHFAKMRVLSIGEDSITFEWAYQTDENNPELKPVVLEKPVHGPEYLIKNF